MIKAVKTARSPLLYVCNRVLDDFFCESEIIPIDFMIIAKVQKKIFSKIHFIVNSCAYYATRLRQRARMKIKQWMKLSFILRINELKRQLALHVSVLYKNIGDWQMKT